MDLLTLALLCGPMVNPALTLRVIGVESGGDPFVIHDDSSGIVYRSGALSGAARIGEQLVRIDELDIHRARPPARRPADRRLRTGDDGRGRRGELPGVRVRNPRDRRAGAEARARR